MSERAPDLSVVVLTWNGRDYVEDCLASLADQDIARPYEVIVVDNGSADGTADVVAAVDNVQLIRLERNCGYCIGNNIGYRRARGRCVLFLNQDTVLHRSCLAELVSVLDSTPSVGAVHANIIQPWYPEFAAMERCRPVAAAYTADLSRLGYVHYRKVPLGPPLQDILFLHGVAIAVKRELIDELGYPFDPDMWAYAEDLDLALRTRAAGYRTAVATRAVLYHKHTLDARLSLQTFLKTVRIIRNRLLSLWKCCTWLEFLPLAIVTTGGAPFNAGEFGLSVRRRVLYFILLVAPALAAASAAAWCMPRFAARRRGVLAGRRQPPWWFLRTMLGSRSFLSVVPQGVIEARAGQPAEIRRFD